MDLAQTSIWDHAFSFPWFVIRKFQQITNFLSRDKFNDEIKTFACNNLYKFEGKCLSHKITNQGALLGFSHGISKVELGKNLIILQPNPFTHGNSSWNYF